MMNLFQRSAVLILLYSVAVKGGGPRVFSEDYIEGLYGRFFEYTEAGNTSPCPRTIDHFGRGSPSALGNSWVVPHDKINENGSVCDDGGVLVLTPYDSRSEMPLALQANNIAEETFNLMKEDSTGFWMGTDSRKCGKWVFPNPTYVFFVREFEKNLKSFFNLNLSAGKKYMFVTAPTFTCIYEGLPRKTPTPTVVITKPVGPGSNQKPTAEANDTPEPDSPGVGGNGESTATPTSSALPVASDAPTSGDSPTPSTEDTTPTGDPSIVDISGATPQASAAPGNSTNIVEVAETDSDNTGDADSSGDDTDSDTDDSPSEDSDSGDGDGSSEENESITDINNDFVDSGNDTEIDGGDSLCFPGDATVELSDGSKLKMSNLSVGDVIRVSVDSFSPVYMFTHRIEDESSTFVELKTNRGETIHLTSGHLLYVNDRLSPAGKVKKGDRLRNTNGDYSIVNVIRIVQRRGVYNPQTLDGRIAVNGIIASTYTRTVTPTIAHSLLAPLRAFWNAFRVNGMRSMLEVHSFSESAFYALQTFGPLPVEREL